MSSSVFLRKVTLRNYMSIGRCSVELGPLNFLVGQNGAGKSNFLDALHFVSSSLNTSVEHALRDRGGIDQVLSRLASAMPGHPQSFSVSLEWCLPDFGHGSYQFCISGLTSRGFVIRQESCSIIKPGEANERHYFLVSEGQILKCSLPVVPAAAPDRLFLVAVSGQPEFRPLYDALCRMGFYNFNPDVIRELQSPDVGEVLAGDGRNLASVLKRLEDDGDAHKLSSITALLAKVIPGITSVSYKPQGKKETLEFRQMTEGSKDPWRFDAENMSDGTLRALGVLVALFQPSADRARRVPLIGIEEPETALHPGAAAVLRTALLEASEEAQIIVTSHSPDLLDDKEIQPEMLLVVTSRAGTTAIGPMDEASRGAIKDHLFTAGELLRLNQIESEEDLHSPPSSAQMDMDLEIAS